MLSTLKIIGLCLAFVGVSAAAVMLFNASHESRKNPLSQESHRQLQPRNPDTDNHEVLRILDRDPSWRLRELDIYKIEGEVRILKNPTDGVNTGGSVDLTTGPRLTVDADESGRHAKKAELKDAKGELIASQEVIAKGIVKTIVPLANDLTAELVNHEGGSERVITVKQANGTPVLEFHMEGLRRTSLKLYSVSGQLLFEETRTGIPEGGMPTVYTAYIHGPPDGRITHKVRINQFSSQDDPGSLDLVETIGDDGKTVIATADTRWDDEKSVSCGVFGDQKGLQAKLQEAFTSVKLIMDANMQLDRAVLNLLQDKTR